MSRLALKQKHDIIKNVKDLTVRANTKLAWSSSVVSL